MENIKKISAAVVAMAMACGMMASCGDSTSDTTDSTAETTATAAAEAADTESEEDTAVVEDTEAFVPQTEFDGYDAFLMFGDSSWLWGNWKGSGSVHSDDWDDDSASFGYGVDADIVGDGEYTVSLTKQSIAGNDTYVNPNVALDGNVPASGAEGTVVFCIDIIGLMDGSEVTGLDDNNEWVNTENDSNKLVEGDNHYNLDTIGDYKASDITATVTSIKCDGQEIEFDASKIKCGNIEDNNNCFRIEIYNSYGSTVSDPAFDPFSIAFEDSLEVTFTIEGLGDIKTFPEVDAFVLGGAETSADSTEDALGEETADADAEEATEDETAAE